MSIDNADPLIAADETRLAAQETARLNQLAADDELRQVMSTPAGRRFIWRLLDRAGMWRSSYRESRQDTDFLEGNRNIALMLWADLQRICPELKLRMQEEHKYV